MQYALESQTPASIVDEVTSLWGLPDVIVNNDVHPITHKLIEHIDLDEFDATYQAVVRFPVELTQRLLPAMKLRRSGVFVFVTSAREILPESGFSVPTTLRAATTTFAKALAKVFNHHHCLPWTYYCQ